MSSPEFQNITPDNTSLENISSRNKKDTQELPLTPEENDSLLEILEAAKEAEKVGDYALATQKYEEYRASFLTLKEEKQGFFTPELSVDYTAIDPETGKETIETITLDFEQKVEEFLSFYERNNMELPVNFRESLQEIWTKNQEGIREAIREKGFNDILLLPPTPNLPDLVKKMEMENGYYESDNFKAGGSFAKAESHNTDKPRLVLLHHAQELNDHPALKETLNIKAGDVPLDEALSLEDYLIFHKKYYEETGTHLDIHKWPWLATKSGPRLVSVRWYSEGRKLRVSAHDLGYRLEAIGCRLSRTFF